MSQQAIQLLAALANETCRDRFAQLTLAGDAGLPTMPKLDRLLIAAGAAVAEGVRTVISQSGLRAALDELRAARSDAVKERPLESIPRRHDDRIAELRRLAAVVLPGPDKISESALNERLAPYVVDVALFRRAMVDHELICRDPHAQLYWRAN